MSVYLHDWAESGEAGMLDDFNIRADRLEGAEVLVAAYTYEDYSGGAYVLFRKDGQFYEVHGSHCSCYGLSESNYSGDTTTQWQPEVIEREALQRRVDAADWPTPGVREAVVAVLAA